MKETAPSPSAAILLIIFIFMLVDGLELVGGVGADQELKLEPQGMIGANCLATVIVVLHADSGELGRIPGQIGRPARLIVAQIGRKRAGVTMLEFPAQSGDNTGFYAPQHLRIPAT